MNEINENLTRSPKSRVHWIDVAKGILILLLLIHHFGPAIKNSEILKQDFYFVFVWQLVFIAFFMQAFLFLSGFCSNLNKPIKSFLKDLFKQLIIPLLFFQTLHYLWYCYNKEYINIGLYLLRINGTTYWFIVSLVISKIYIYTYLRFFSNYLYLLISTLILFIFAIFLNDFEIGNNFMSIRNSLGSVVFVALGQYFRWKKHLLNKCLYIGSMFPAILFLTFILGIKPPFFTAWIGVSLKTIPLFFLTSLSGTMAFFYLCIKIKESVFFEYFGKNSLLVYGYHIIPLKLLVIIFYRQILPDTFFEKVLYLVLVYSFEILICFILIEIFSRKPFKWLVGKF